MPRLLHLETTAGVCGVALTEGEGRVVVLREHEEANAHSRVLAPMIEAALAEAGWRVGDLDAVAVGSGPGSYTGLRIGASTAKGLCYAAGLPLIAVPTLEALAGELARRHPAAAHLVPLLDARRMEVFTAAFARDGQVAITPRALVLDETHPFGELLASGIVAFGGSGAEKARPLLGHKNAVLEISLVPRVAYGCALAHKYFKINAFEDVAGFEPQYLKAVWTTVSRSAGPRS